MARESMVTRTFKTSVATILCLDTVAEASTTVTAVLPREYKTEKELMKAAKKAVETDTLKVVKVKSVETKEVIYGMPESDFIAYAKVVTRGKAESAE